MNNLQHGFTGQFRVLAWEDQDQFNLLFVRLHGEHKPSTLTAEVLVDKVAQAALAQQARGVFCRTSRSMSYHPRAWTKDTSRSIFVPRRRTIAPSTNAQMTCQS
jgi:hypothetical protein